MTLNDLRVQLQDETIDYFTVDTTNRVVWVHRNGHDTPVPLEGPVV